ncbi:type II secretion system secretin GspD [Serratia quinivorans]|uniref:type II secretion system secretin GspD n=1 Tax=Serratia quinivorans TaxID=137545 RepID=UPI0021BD246A|nr:type II secretion system secretin GspD [Serratia quinivorans]
MLSNYYPKSLNIFHHLAFILSLIISLPAHSEVYSASFKNTDINEFINTVSKNLNKTIIIEPSVKGYISVRSYQNLDQEQYYSFFLSVLEVYGFAVVKMPNGVTKVIPAKNAKGMALPLIEDEGMADGDEIILRVVSLHNVPAKELAPLLRQLNDAASGSVVHYDPSNVLLLTGRAAVINSLVAVIRNVDKAGDQTVDTVHLQYASAEEVVRMVNTLHKSNKKANGSIPMSASVVSDERTNTVLIAGEEQARQRMEKIVRKLDRKGEERGNTRVIYLKYAKASNLLEVLNGVSNPLKEGNSQAIPSVAMMKNVVIKADEQTNALIINAAPDVMRDLERVIEQLDIRRAQVLVEAIIVEVQDADGLNLGVQWFNRYGGGTNFPDTGASVTALKPGGLNQALKGVTGLATGFYSGNWAGLLTALSTSSQNDILATPSIVTLDNMEAEFSVGQDVPVLTGSQTTTGDNVFNTVARKSVGIMLKVKPQINQGDSVLLEIEQEVSSVAEKAPSGTSDLGATFNTRTVKNAVLVSNGNTVVVGGLLDTTNTDINSKVPFLGDIPGIGALFRSTNQKTVKRNLMLFIRPTIIREQTAYDRASANKLDKFNQVQTHTGNTSLPVQLNEALSLPLNNQAFQELQRDIAAFYQPETS